MTQMYSIDNELITAIQDELRAQRHIASGEGYRSIRVTTGADDITVYGRTYLRYVHYGRRAGKMPPVNKIKNWCNYIGISPHLAYAIARSIARRGVPGQPYIYWQEGNTLVRTNFAVRAYYNISEKIKKYIIKKYKTQIYNDIITDN